MEARLCPEQPRASGHGPASPSPPPPLYCKEMSKYGGLACGWCQGGTPPGSATVACVALVLGDCTASIPQGAVGQQDQPTLPLRAGWGRVHWGGPPETGKTPNPHRAPTTDHKPQSRREGRAQTECRTHPGWPGFESGLRHRHAVQTRPQPVASSSHPPGNRVPGGLQCFHSPQAEPLQMPTLPPSFRTTYLTRGPMGSVLMAQRRHRPAEETRGHPALHY